jgi:hypothetical protein
MARGLLEVEHLLPDSPESWLSPDITNGDLVIGYFAMFGTTGSAE